MIFLSKLKSLTFLGIVAIGLTAWFYNTSMQPGPLTSAHSQIPSCEVCHEYWGKPTAAKCGACHAEIEQQATQGWGYHAAITSGCGSCHVEHRGRDYPLVQPVVEDFEH